MDYDTPLYDALKAYSKKNIIPFHMPGHKMGAGIPKHFRENILDIDLTELQDTDDLHAPEGPIEEAQQLAAQVFGAHHTFFLVNGSTCGIQTMIASVCSPGDVLILDRNCHKSVIHSLILCGIVPQYIHPEYIADLGLTGGIDPNAIEEALIKYPTARGVLVTCPTYYGICSDLKAIANIVHKYDKVLLVDEAHGAHFCFHPSLPSSALNSGADMCVQSAHKTLPALTQSSLLHINSIRIDIQRIKNCLKMFQSSSPSFVLMAYLDISRSIMQCNGMHLLEDLIQWSNQARKTINEENTVYCPGNELIDSYHIKALDSTRLVANFSNVDLAGYQVEKELYLHYGIQVEMSDLNNVIAIMSIGNTQEQVVALAQSLKSIASGAKIRHNAAIIGKNIIPQLVMKPADAFYSSSKAVDIRDAVGSICAGVVTSYPPGVPILCPGEVITRDIIEYILSLHELGGKVTGLENEMNIRILKNL